MEKTNKNNMNILVGQFHMNSLGGTEEFTYTLCKILKKIGHNVDLITFNPGFLSDKLTNEFNIPVNNLSNNYDICLTNHNNVVRLIRSRFPNLTIIQTSHGIIPELEKFDNLANKFVSISAEIQNHFSNFNSTIIWNGIDTDRFKPNKPLNAKIKRILSLTQSNKANKIIQDVCDKLDCELLHFDKNRNPKFNIEDDINNSDLVFGLGRSAYTAMSCGRPVFVWDFRHYMGNLGDGFLTPDNYNSMMENNTSGRKFNKSYTSDDIVKEIKEKYSKNLLDDMRSISLTDFNMEKQISKYLSL